MFLRILILLAELIARRLQRLSRIALDIWNWFFNPVVDYFELAHGFSMRMCPELEKKFPDFHGRQLELMVYLCLVAYNSEIYDGLCDDAWLRTRITLKDDQVDYAHVFSNPGSREIRLMAALCEGTPMCESSWKQLEKYQSTLTSRIEIRWNILPRTAYWERLQKVQRQSNWTRVQPSLLWRTPCFSSSSSREFIPITVIDQARQKGSSLKEKVDEWRKNGGRCDLATHLQTSVVRPTKRRESLRTIETDREADKVVSMRTLGEGSAATVYEVSWRNGTYAMKSFKSSVSEMTFKERLIAERVLHPHIIHGFGYFESDGRWNLLMEMLDKTLTRHSLEESNLGKPLFSREDTLDVLLQIASAVEHLHLNDVVHGDLKPDNIVLSSFEILGNGRHFLAKVTDFGDAGIFVREQLFKPVGFGTTALAAPELLEWRQDQENVWLAHPEKIDVYSFGGVAHEVLTGYPVYSERKKFNATFGTDVIAGTLKPSGSDVWRNSGLEKRFPVELIELVEQCWELRPEDRPSFSRICEVLERCKPVVQFWEERAAEEKETAKKRAAELLKLFAMVSLIAFTIWTPSLTTEKSAIDPFKFIALILFIFIVMSYLCRFIRCVVCKFRDVFFAVKVKDL